MQVLKLKTIGVALLLAVAMTMTLTTTMTLTMTSVASASGSGGGSSGSSGGSSGGDSERISRYDFGKKIFKEQVVCESCPHAGLVQTPDNVAAILPDVVRKSGEVGGKLGFWERRALKHYIKRRFDL